MATKVKETVKKTTTVKVVQPEAKAVKKPVAAKPAVAVAKKETVKAEAPVTVVKKTVKSAKMANNLTVSVKVVSIDGKDAGTMDLPAEIFGEKVNKILLAQAVRIYLANQRQGNASTKTRGEVDGSTRKIYRQKGTGRARHGGVRAPIFVKGGIVFGPKPRDYSLSFPQKMKRKALLSALSAKAQASQITVLAGLGGLEPKTKLFVEMLKKVGLQAKNQKMLFVTSADLKTTRQAGNNVPGVSFANVQQLHVYEVLNTNNLVFDKTGIEELKKRFLGEDK